MLCSSMRRWLASLRAFARCHVLSCEPALIAFLVFRGPALMETFFFCADAAYLRQRFSGAHAPAPFP